MTWSRREFIRASGLAMAGGLVAACDSSSGGTGDGPLRFWCHNGELRYMFERLLKKFETESGGVPTEFTYEPLKTLGRSLQLAWQSGQMPDIHTLGGLETPAATLQASGWFQPMDLGDARKRLPADSQIEGIHVFDGKTYSFPVISFRQYWAPVWYRADVVEQHGLDPDDPPRTYDEFRAACRAVKKASGGKVFGWMSKLGTGNHMGPETEEIAQAAGFTGDQGIDFRTGEYAYHSEPFVAAVEFLLSLHRDGLMFPGSLTLGGPEAQLRWAGGATGFWFDGPWLPRAATRKLPESQRETVSEQLRVAPMLVPERGMPVTAYRPPAPGLLWISAKSSLADAASLVLGRHFTTPEFFAGVAESSAVPFDLAAVERADVHPMYRRLVGWYGEQVFLAPAAVVRNPDVAKVTAQLRPVQPSYFDTLHGLFTGDLPDVRKALRQLSDRLSAERERAVKAAVAEGAKVSLDDWAFDNWTPREDYTTDRYPG